MIHFNVLFPSLWISATYNSSGITSVPFLIIGIIITLFNDVISSNCNSNVELLDGNELERIGPWKGAVVSWFKVLSWHLFGETEENKSSG